MISLFGWLSVKAQENNTNFFLDAYPLNSFSNPAYQPLKEEFILGLPLVSGIGINSVSGFPFNSLFKIGNTGNGFGLDFNSLYNVLDEDNKTRITAFVPLFFAGLRKGNRFFSFSIMQKGMISLHGSPGLVKFLSEGNAPYWGKNEDLGTSSFNALYFRELGFGFSSKISDRMFFGGRGKILFGKTYIQADQIAISLMTNESERYLALSPEGSFKMAAPVSVNFTDSLNYTTVGSDLKVGDYFYSLRNLGFSADFGITWLPGQDFKIQVSLVDAGFVGFRRKTYSFSFFRAIQYQERNLYQSKDPNSDIRYKSPRKVISALSDSLSYIIIPNNLKERILVSIPLKMAAGLEYQVSSRISTGLVYRYIFQNEFSTAMLSSVVMFSPFKTFETALSYNIQGNAQNSFGLAFNYKPENFNFYFTSDNITGILRPGGSKILNLYFGIFLKFKT